MANNNDFVHYILENPTDPLSIVTMVVLGLIVLACIFGIVISIYLSVRYVKFNRKQNSCGMAGKDIARKLLDDNGLENIKVKATGSMIFGNSYSHFFKKVRLRRLTWKKESVTSLGMAAQKVALAVLDKEKDPDMRRRIRLTPIMFFGPISFIPLLIIGIIVDILVFKTVGVLTLVVSLAALLFYVLSIVMTFCELHTEKKAQKRAYVLLQESRLANEEEITMLKKLFKLYNLEYINNIIIATLQMILLILRILIAAKSNGSKSGS